ncbi:MarR family winged helix-turn-helix transcriptional regulator [Micromonospora aurantiaca (nom. illeg.)]|uniref:MarR family winged helix-turn-helix transcriptional regulator n=1 Tax=Micromonospora aurantiaca (nom. illeg.) TaxID=47850 RepID=UPI003438AC5A
MAHLARHGAPDARQPPRLSPATRLTIRAAPLAPLSELRPQERKPMKDLSLTPAAQAVLDALTDLGQGDVHELADRAGKARSTTDKALKTLADAGLIVPVDTDADAADGASTRWALPAPDGAAAAEPDAGVDLGDQQTAAADDESEQLIGSDLDTSASEPANGGAADPSRDDHADKAPDEAGDETDHDDSRGRDDDSSEAGESSAVLAVQPARPGDRKVMAIKGVLADYGDAGATIDLIVAESGIGHATASRLLTAMEQADAARRLPGLPERWVAGPTRASEVDPNPEPPRCPLCSQVIRGQASMPIAAAAVLPLIRPDGTLHVVDADGETHVVAMPLRASGRTPRVARSTGQRGDGTVNADGSPPFGRGELERLTLDVLAANPGQQMTPQDIATVLAGQLGRAISSGAVRNNCTKAAAGGRIVLVSDAPLTFVHPAQPDSDNPVEADAGSTDQS